MNPEAGSSVIVVIWPYGSMILLATAVQVVLPKTTVPPSARRNAGKPFQVVGQSDTPSGPGKPQSPVQLLSHTFPLGYVVLPLELIQKYSGVQPGPIGPELDVRRLL